MSIEIVILVCDRRELRGNESHVTGDVGGKNGSRSLASERPGRSPRQRGESIRAGREGCPASNGEQANVVATVADGWNEGKEGGAANARQAPPILF
jgi:hypothetical protein